MGRLPEPAGPNATTAVMPGLVKRENTHNCVWDRGLGSELTRKFRVVDQCWASPQDTLGGANSQEGVPTDAGVIRVYKAPKKHISKNQDRDIPYKPPYNEANEVGISL